MNTYDHVLISAENIAQATVILDALLEKKLIFGGPIISGPAKFWWKGRFVPWTIHISSPPRPRVSNQS